MQLPLLCKDKRFPPQGWSLLLREDGLFVADPWNRWAASIPRADFERRVTLPSFAESVKDLGFRMDGGELIWFEPQKQVLDAIRQYRSAEVATKGPEAIRSLRTRGWWFLIGGSVMAVICVALTLIGMIQVYNNPNGGTYYVLFPGAIVAIVFAGKGLSDIRTAKLAEQQLPPGSG
jgi:hypothetical protein